MPTSARGTKFRNHPRKEKDFLLAPACGVCAIILKTCDYWIARFRGRWRSGGRRCYFFVTTVVSRMAISPSAFTCMVVPGLTVQ